MEDKREQMNYVAMDIILHAGDADILVDQALEQMAVMEFEKAKDLLKKAKEEILTAHNSQTSLIQDEAAGAEYPNSLLFNHSQDTFMACQSHYNMANSLLDILCHLSARLDKLEQSMKPL